MTEPCKVTQWMVDQLVEPEVQQQMLEKYKGIDMDAVRIAWPFKTEEELEKMARWLKKEEQIIKKKQKERHVEIYGKAFL